MKINTIKPAEATISVAIGTADAAAVSAAG